MSDNNNSNGGGIGFFGLLWLVVLAPLWVPVFLILLIFVIVAIVVRYTILFIGLKLGHVIYWSW